MKPLRLHHVGIIMPTMEKAEMFLEQFGLEKDYMEYDRSLPMHTVFLQNIQKKKVLWN